MNSSPSLLDQKDIRNGFDVSNYLRNFLSTYLDDYHKEKYFLINRNAFMRMGNCFNNIRQVNEKGEECVKKERKILDDMVDELSHHYTTNSKILNKCTKGCKNESDVKCISECSNIFINEYHRQVTNTIIKYGSVSNKI